MFAKPLHKTIAIVPNKGPRIVSYEGEVLPEGNWLLNIEAGHAWVFCNDRNVPLHKGQTLELRPEDGDVQIRALYARGIAAYEAARQ